VEDLQARRAKGGCFVNTELLTRVSDAEMDMNRAVDRQARGSKMSGMVAAALSWLAPRSTALRPPASKSIATPRRSVDHQLEQFRDFRWFSSPLE
jgi:hypothetical protein